MIYCYRKSETSDRKKEESRSTRRVFVFVFFLGIEFFLGKKRVGKTKSQISFPISLFSWAHAFCFVFRPNFCVAMARAYGSRSKSAFVLLWLLSRKNQRVQPRPKLPLSGGRCRRRKKKKTRRSDRTRVATHGSGAVVKRRVLGVPAPQDRAHGGTGAGRVEGDGVRHGGRGEGVE